MRGVISNYRRDKLYGFVKPDGGGEAIFFCLDDVVPDAVGRRRVFVHMPVEFEPRLPLAHQERCSPVPGQPFRKYYSIKPLWADPDEPTPELKTYREESVITYWVPPKDRGFYWSGFACRQDGSSISVFEGNVITQGIIGVGTKIYHGVRPPDRGDGLWIATQVEVVIPRAR